MLDPVVDYLEAAAQSAGPSLLLIPNTLSGRDVAGRFVARLGAGIVADVADFRIEGAEVDCISPKLGGAIVTDCALRPGDYGVATVRPNAFAAAPGGAGAEIRPLEKPAGKRMRRSSRATSKKAPASSRSRKPRSSLPAAAVLAGRNPSIRC